MSVKDEVYEKLNKASELTSFPAIVMKLNDMLEDMETSTDDIVDVIKFDPVISSSVLRLANTMAFNISGRVSSIDKAVIRLGFGNVKDMVLTVSMVNNFSKGGTLNYMKFWTHSISVAFTAKIIREYASESAELSDELYTTGLLHEIGILIFDQWMGDLYKDVLAEYAKGERDLLSLERSMLGMDHCEAGAYILEKWKLPRTVVDAVRFSRRPHLTSAIASENTKMVHMADYACNNQGISNGLEEESQMKFSESAWFDLGLSIGDIPTIIDQVNLQTEKAKEILAVAYSKPAVV